MKLTSQTSGYEFSFISITLISSNVSESISTTASTSVFSEFYLMKFGGELVADTLEEESCATKVPSPNSVFFALLISFRITFEFILYFCYSLLICFQQNQNYLVLKIDLNYQVLN